MMKIKAKSGTDQYMQRSEQADRIIAEMTRALVEGKFSSIPMLGEGFDRRDTSNPLIAIAAARLLHAIDNRDLMQVENMVESDTLRTNTLRFARGTGIPAVGVLLIDYFAKCEDWLAVLAVGEANTLPDVQKYAKMTLAMADQERLLSGEVVDVVTESPDKLRARVLSQPIEL